MPRGTAQTIGSWVGHSGRKPWTEMDADELIELGKGPPPPLPSRSSLAVQTGTQLAKPCATASHPAPSSGYVRVWGKHLSTMPELARKGPEWSAATHPAAPSSYLKAWGQHLATMPELQKM